MRIVIDIPEEVKQVFDNAKNEDLYGNYYDYNSLIGKAIRNGTPLLDINVGDLISRQAVLNLFNKSDEYRWETSWIRRRIEKLPSVEPERKAGKWVLLSDDEVKKGSISWLYCSTAWMNYKCSSCGKIVHNRLMGHEENRTKYCPNCGSYNGG